MKIDMEKFDKLVQEHMDAGMPYIEASKLARKEAEMAASASANDVGPLMTSLTSAITEVQTPSSARKIAECFVDVWPYGSITPVPEMVTKESTGTYTEWKNKEGMPTADDLLEAALEDMRNKEAHHQRCIENATSSKTLKTHETKLNKVVTSKEAIRGALGL